MRRSAVWLVMLAIVAALVATIGLPTNSWGDDGSSSKTNDVNTPTRDLSFLTWEQIERVDLFPREKGYEEAYDSLREHANQSFEGVSTLDKREIVCWGDSMTEGWGASKAVIRTGNKKLDVSYMAYPQILQSLTGVKTYNFGVSGATSEEIALMQGAISIEQLRAPLEVFWPRIASTAEQHPGDILILEIGSNGGWANKYKRLINQYKAMIEHAGCTDYLIVGDTDDPGTSIADLKQRAFNAGEGPGETSWEAALRKAFGDRFINMRVYLIENGLDLCGLKETAEDRYMASCGCISTQLRADWTHFNSYGYYAQAVGIYERGVELGFWGPEYEAFLERLYDVDG